MDEHCLPSSQSGKEAPRGLDSMLPDQLLFKSPSGETGAGMRVVFSTIRPVTAAILGGWPFPMFSTVRSEMPKSLKQSEEKQRFRAADSLFNIKTWLCWF